jgi:TorA maturation chaperone TorD
VLAGEHVFLFDRQVRCPPYESAYTAAPRMAGKSAELADVAGFYTAFGLMPAEARPDMEDHIAVELEFMSALALKEAYALAEADADGVAVTRAAEVAFLTDHLGRWAEAFGGSLRAATPLPYYAAAAELLTAWVLAEVAALKATPTRLEALADPGPAGDEAFTCPMTESEEALTDRAE